MNRLLQSFTGQSSIFQLNRYAAFCSIAENFQLIFENPKAGWLETLVPNRKGERTLSYFNVVHA